MPACTPTACKQQSSRVSELSAGHMVVSVTRGAPISTPNYSNPLSRDPNKNVGLICTSGKLPHIQTDRTSLGFRV